MERKRTGSQLSLPSKTENNQVGVQKKAKLTLKPPSFITASQAKKVAIRSFDTFLESLLECETSDEILERLLWFVDVTVAAKPQSTVLKNVNECLALLGKVWRQHTDHLPVCGVLLNLFVLIVSAVDGALTESVEEFALSAVKHPDVTVKVASLKCVQRIISRCSNECRTRVLELALSEIHCSYHKVRMECVNLIGQLSHVTGRQEDSLVILEERCADADPRVRTAAFNSLCTLLREGVALSQSIYSKASECLSDDSEDVRTSALKVVWRMGLKHQDKKIPLREDSSVEIRVLDDAFMKICNLVNDSSIQIRALAAGLLGDFNSVSQEFLSQTLDKKLMSHLRVVKSEHERQKELHQQGASVDWETGRKWTGGALKMEIDPGEISLMDAGACGAFVHGLEDEFMEVRSAAIGSICRLGISNSVFASQCLDYLVDMFNDEIQSVRLKSINSLGRIAATMVLRDDQLETVLGILEESSSEIRDALRSLLCTCQIMTRGGLNTTVHSLLDNLKKYPTDRQSIWRCLKQLGSHHGSLVSTLVPELLSIHPFFMGKEPDVDDPAYICILILVFNAAAHCPTIPPLFPSHVFRHYTYLRDTLPQLIPHIRNGVPSVMKVGQSRLREGHSSSRVFVAQVLSRAQSASSLSSPREQQGVWQSCISDLQRVRKLDCEVASSAHCAAIFIQCQLLINKVSDALSQDVLLSSEGSSQQNLPPLVANIRELLLLSYRLEHCFTDLNSDLLLRAKMVRVVTNALSLLLATHVDLDTGNRDVFQMMKLSFQERLKSIQRFCESTKLPVPSVLNPLLTDDLATTATEHLTHLLHTLSREQFCTDLPLSDLQLVRQTECELLSPEPLSSEEHTRFVSSLALSVDVQATIKNVPDREHLAVQVVFPDGKRLLFPIKATQIREIEPNELKLDTSVVLSHGIWTEPSRVEVCVVLKYQTDVNEDNCLLLHSKSNNHKEHTRQGASIAEGICSGQLSGSPVHSHPEDGLVTERSALVISDTVGMNIYPQEKASNSFGAFLDPVNRL